MKWAFRKGGRTRMGRGREGEKERASSICGWGERLGREGGREGEGREEEEEREGGPGGGRGPPLPCTGPGSLREIRQSAGDRGGVYTSSSGLPLARRSRPGPLLRPATDARLPPRASCLWRARGARRKGVVRGRRDSATSEEPRGTGAGLFTGQTRGSRGVGGNGQGGVQGRR